MKRMMRLETLCRGYGDQKILDAMFMHFLWRVCSDMHHGYRL